MSKPTNHQLIIRACTSLASATLCATIFLTINTNNVKASAMPLPVQSNVEKNVNQANHLIQASDLLNERRNMLRNGILDNWQNVDYSYDESTKTLTIKGGTLVDPNPILYQFATKAGEIQAIKITGKLTLEGSADGLFNNLQSLKEINGANNINTSQVTNMLNMFYGCKKLNKVDVSNWNTSQVTNMCDMFSGCNVLDGLDVSNWNTSKVTNMSGMFENCQKLSKIDVGNWDTSQVTHMSMMFDTCQTLSKIDVSNWNTSKATDMYRMFDDCNVLDGLDVSNWNTSQVTDMSWMFYGCNVLDGLDVGNWDTSKVTNMAGMFYDCNVLDGLDVGNWNTSKVTDMSFMFIGCHKLSKINVSNWNTSKVTNMDGMFWYCFVLDDLDVSNWNTSQVTDMSCMFIGCQNLTKLDLSNFNDHQVDDKVLNHGHTNMLSGLLSLVELRLGPNINIAETGLNTPVEWVSVGKGTIAKPAGTEYYSSNDLAKFWNNKDYTETWVPGIKHNIKVNYVDLDDNNKVIQSDSISGNSIHPIEYKSSFDKIVADLKTKHYEYVSSSDKLPWSNGKIQLPDDVTDNTTYTVGFKHATTDVSDGDKNPITGDTITGLNKEIKQTIKYTGMPNNIADNVQTVRFTRGGKVDLITGKVILQDWNESEQSFKDVDSPKVAGYEPDSATVKGATVKPTDSDVTKEVKYSRGSYKITIKYVDTDDNDKVVKTDTVNGNPEKVIAYKDKLDSILKSLSGYVLNKDKTTLPLDSDGNIKLADDTLADTEYQVGLEHDSKTMHAGDKNPVTGKDEDGLTKTITQTIKYTGAPTTISDSVQKITFKRDADVDIVTGKLTYHDWDNKALSFKDVDSPKVVGYVPDIATVKGTTVSPTDSDIIKEVKYSRGSYNINIDYVDSSTGKTIKTDKVSGNPDKVISYQDQLKQILHDLPGYVVDKDKTNLPLDNNNDIKLPNTVTGDKDYQIILKHDSKTMHAGDKNPVTGKDEDSLTKTITQTIKYTGTPSTISDNIQKVTFKRDADVDMVTGKLTYHDWDEKEQSFKDVDSPKVAGYKPDIITVKGATVKPTDSDVAREVKYSRGSYNIDINYVDSSTGKTIKTDKVSGNPDKVISYQDQLKQILHDLPGYVIDKDKTTLPLDDNNDIKLPNTVTGDKDYQIVLKHDSKTMHAGDKNPVTGKDEDSLTKTITQIIKYTGAPTDINDNVQKVTFKRDADVDMVTGKLTYHDWKDKEQSFKDVDSPIVSGYTPDISTIKGSKVTADSNDITKQVTYTKDKSDDTDKNDPDYEITIDYQDENGKTIKTDKQKGKANSTIPYKDRMQEIINSIAKNGYEVDWSNSNLPVDSNGNIKLGAITGNTNYKLVLKHKIVTFKYGEKNPFTGQEDPNLERKVTQTIKYLHSGKNLPNNVQELTFTRDAQVDMITGKVTYLEWHEGKQTFKDVTSPTVQGYATDLPIVKGRTVTGNSKDIVQLVSYHKSNIVQTGLNLTRNKQTTILGIIVAALASLLSCFGITKKKGKK